MVMKMDYSTKITKIKEQFHLDDVQFADILNVSVVEVREWQKGIQKPSKESLKILYDVFGVTSNMLFNTKKRCLVYAMRIKLNKGFQLMDAIYSYYGQWRVCALRKRLNLYILNPIMSFLFFIVSPFETISDAVIDVASDSIKKDRNYVDYVDYLVENNENAILINYKNGYAFIQALPNVPKKSKFKFNGRIYKKIGYMD